MNFEDEKLIVRHPGKAINVSGEVHKEAKLEGAQEARYHTEYPPYNLKIREDVFHRKTFRCDFARDSKEAFAHLKFLLQKDVEVEYIEILTDQIEHVYLAGAKIWQVYVRYIRKNDLVREKLEGAF